MKNIVKSFYNYMVTFWYQFLAFVLFVLISCALTVGFVSNSLQIISVGNKINREEKSWNYDVNTYFSEFQDSYIYKYFEEPEEVGLSHPTLLNKDVLIGDQQISLEKYLNDAFKGPENTLQNWENFVGKFIRRNIFNSPYSNQHLVTLPKINKRDSEPQESFFALVDPYWQKLTAENLGEVYNLINQDLMKQYSAEFSKDSIELSVNKMFKYHPIFDGKTSEEFYSLEPLNLGQINNVISDTPNKNLAKMKDNEILVNDKFAKVKGWKIGDKVKLHEFELATETNKEEYEQRFGQQFNQEYKIVGWGTKIQNLFATYDFLDPDHTDSSKTQGFFYLTNQEFNRYWSYLWYYNYRVYYPPNPDNQNLTQMSQRLPSQSNYYERLKVANKKTLSNFNGEMRSKSIRTNMMIALNYNDLYFVQAFQIYLIEGIVFCLVGFISLLFAILFINYSVKKQLRQMRRQLGLFKSLGYETIDLATILWSRTYVLLMVGVILGYLVSIPIQMHVNTVLVPGFYVIIEPVWLDPIFLVVIFLVLPLLMSLINFAAIIRYLHKNALAMIYMDKNFSMGSNYRKPMSWIIKTRSINLGKLHLNFSWKEFFMSLFIPLFFMFGTLLLMVQFNINTLMTSTIDLNSHVYRSNMNYSITMANDFNWKTKSTNDKYFLKDENLYKFKYINYQKASDLDKYHNPYLDEAIKKYLNTTSILEIPSLLSTISSADINHQAVNLTDSINVAKKLVDDYERFKGIPGLKQYESSINQLKELLEMSEKYETWLKNKKAVMTVNNAFIKQNVDYPILKLELFSYHDLVTTGNWNLFMVNNQNQTIFTDLNYSLLKEKSEAEQNHSLIPVIISEQFSKKNNIKVGTIFDSFLNYSGSNIYLNFKVVGINHDKVSSNIYGCEDYFLKHFVGSTSPVVGEIEPIYNTIYSKGNLFDVKQTNWQKFELQNDYFNFYFSTSKDEVTVMDLFNNSNQLFNYFNWENLTTSNFKSLALERQLAYNTIGDLTRLVYILLGFTLLLLLTLFEVFFILGTVDNQLQIKLFKAFGYSENYISLRLLRKHIISISFGVILAIIVNYFVWKAMISWINKAFNLMLYNPFSITWTLVSCLIMVVLFIIGAMIGYVIIKKTSPVIKAA